MARSDPPLVVVITAWREDGGLRARVVAGDRRASVTRACASLPDLLRAVEAVVDAWQRRRPTPR